ncbi:MAG: carboxypeptidase regulatory-like domain-containing protein, partial [Dinghuibacter sp.]|nr:carboxypeptidase regulatory-like domain-containing protein [Dinghuibacter sp.]
GDPDNDINFDDNGQVTVGNETRGLAITLVAGTEPDGTNTNTNNNITYDFGFYAPKVSLGNFVFIDRNDNGIFETANGDFGLDGITVVLYRDNDDNGVADGAAVASTTTTGGGFYSFSNLLQGKYFIQLENLPSWAFMTTVNGGDPDNNIDNDNNGLTHNVAGGIIKGGTIELTAGSEPDVAVDGDGTSGNRTYDFGLFKTNGLGDYVWVDNDGDGFQDAGEPGIANVTVRLKNSAGTVLATTTTNSEGFYFFYDPAQYGTFTYTIEFVTPAGYVPTVSNAVGDDTKDSDPINGQIINVNVPNGVWNHTFDAGYVQPASLGDRVWKDDDGDGVQDPGEVGVAGVTLVLLDAAGNVVATTTTDALGNYKFSNLKPGNYTVRITPPANYSLSPAGQGGNGNTDSDFNPNTFVTNTVTLVSGQNRTDVDAGLKFSQPQTASVGDRVWLDNDADGIQDAGEPGVSNVLVTLYNSAGSPIRSTYTDVNGNYLFTDVPAGTYSVGFTLPPAMVFSPNSGAVSVANNSDANPATGRTANFTVNAGDQITYVDAGIRTQVITNGSVGDFVFNDLDKDGTQDAGEPGIPGVTVRLINANTGAVVATTTTDAVGKYIFNDVPPGDYQVEFVTPTGYTTTTRLSPNPVSSGTDSDVNAATGRTGVFSLGAGQRISIIDAGYWVTTPPGTAKLGDRVWYDVDQDGVQDAGEPSVPGITVVLYNSAGTAIATTVTDQNGNYYFTDLAAGTYSVGFSNLPTGFTFTTQGAGTAATGSDANPATGRTGTVTLVAGQVNLDVDAGIKQAQAGTASLGNKVWYDLNNNGLQDAGELGVQGVSVALLDAAGNAVDNDLITPGVQPATATTNALGEYLFTGLQAGEYLVRFGNLPAGYTVVAKNAGTNRNIDSDGNPLAAGTSTTDLVSLSINQERLDIDLGIYNATAPLGQLGDRVWFDTDNDGVQDAGEQGVPGVSVALRDAAGNIIRTTVTDKDGIYKFINLPDATYSVQFTNLPAGFVFSPRDQVLNGGNDTNDSDADPATGITGTYVISGGNSNMTADAGIYSTRAALGDYVWLDSDADGIQDATESGIPGVTVTLYDAAGNAVASTITDQNGRYFFSNLNPGNYTVGFSTIPQQLAFTTRDNATAGDGLDSDVDPATGRTGTVALAAGQVNLTVDAGLKPFVPASVGDFVWNDRNADGIQTAGEPGVAGVIVTLYNSANQPIGSAVTDGNGFYLITNVPPGTGYYLIFTNKPGTNSPWTTPNVLTGGGTIDNNSKANSAGQTANFSVAEGQNIRNMDAGIVLPSSVPVRLIGFTGNLNGNIAVLQWSTAQEQNTSHFDVERSTDGANFSKVGMVSARGNSSVRSDYYLNDNLAGISVNKVYYRLKVVDRNGTVEYTNIVIIRLSDVKITNVYPNPFSDVIRIETDNKVREMGRVSLYDVTGKVVMSRQQLVEAGGNLITINGLQNLPQGTYTLELVTSEQKIAQKLVKK